MSEQSSSPVVDRVLELLGPVISTTGHELLDVEWTGGTLRIVVDRVDGSEEGVTTGGLTEVNRLVSPILDQHDPVPGRYTLEVSSPGVERPLRRLDHFRRAVGEDVVVKLVPDAEPRRLKGRLASADEDGLTIDTVEVDGVDLDEPAMRTVALADVAKARTVFEWGPSPKPGKGGSGGRGAGKKSAKKKSGKGAMRDRQAAPVETGGPGDDGTGAGDTQTATPQEGETSQR